MNFEHPEVLYVLPALLLPVIVHLFNFRRYKRVIFSNVQFLTEIQQRQASRTHLRERLILLTRLLTVLFLIFAFARPSFSGRQQGTEAANQVISIFVDNSNSMQTLNREGTLLDEAKPRAKEIAAAYGPNDRFQLLTQDFEGKHQRLLTADEFNTAVDTLALSAQSRSLQQIINRQQNFLNLQSSGPKSSYIISDFQRNLFNGQPIKANNLKSLNLVSITAAGLPNIAVDSVLMLNAIHRPGIQEKAIIKLHNYSNKDAAAVPVKLFINNIQKAAGSISIKANQAGSDTVTFSGLTSGWQQARVQLQDNPVTFDNRFYFTFNVQSELLLLLINGTARNIYLTSAFATDPFFKPVQVSSGNVNYAGLNRYPLIILTDVKTVDPGLSQQLQGYVKNGGTLMVFPADGADLVSYQRLLQPLNTPWPVQLVTEHTKVAALNARHPVFRGIFEQQPDRPDLPVAEKYYRFSQKAGRSGNPIMQLPGSDIFLSGYASGKGTVYLSAVPLDEGYSNLPRHALLLPVLFRVALIGRNDAPLYYYIGQNERLHFPGISLKEKQLLYLSNGTQRLIPDVQTYQNQSTLFVADQIRQPGVYRLLLKDSVLAAYAFNGGRAESDLHYLNDDTLKKLLPAGTKLFAPGTKPLTRQLATRNNGLQLWKVSLILALLCITAEIVLIRRMKTGGNTQATQ